MPAISTNQLDISVNIDVLLLTSSAFAGSAFLNSLSKSTDLSYRSQTLFHALPIVVFVGSKRELRPSLMLPFVIAAMPAVPNNAPRPILPKSFVLFNEPSEFLKLAILDGKAFNLSTRLRALSGFTGSSISLELSSSDGFSGFLPKILLMIP